ncbi:MAG: hypothetical protein LBM68_04290 [Bacteroidales bacterium]|nr:hypothetical protein [Bacteroidales bacterium]
MHYISSRFKQREESTYTECFVASPESRGRIFSTLQCPKYEQGGTYSAPTLHCVPNSNNTKNEYLVF